MSSYQTGRFACLCILICTSYSTLSATNSAISLELGADDNNGDSYYLTGKHRFNNGLQIRASRGESASLESDNKELTSESYSIGVKSDPLAMFSVGLDLSHSQQSDSLEIDARTLTFEFNTLDWNVYASPEWRDISIALNINKKVYEFESNGLIAGVGYYGWDPVYLSYSRASYDYPSQISTFNSRPNLYNYVFGSTTYNQVFALEDKRSSFEAGYFFNRASIAVSHSKGQSTVDQSISKVNTIYFSFNIDKSWTLGTTAGRSQVDTSDSSTRFISISLAYKW